MFKVYEIKQRVFESNEREADELRSELKKRKTFLLNLMSSPGAGKTTTLKRTIEALKNELAIGVMEADIDSDVDARAIAETGCTRHSAAHRRYVPSGRATMTRQGLDEFGVDGLDLGCFSKTWAISSAPAEFDTGSVKNAMILSVPEGDDKPLEIPADVLHLPRAARQQDRRAAVF